VKCLWKVFEFALGVVCDADLLDVEEELMRIKPLVSVVFGDGIGSRGVQNR
jgi:hypothetical protein